MSDVVLQTVIGAAIGTAISMVGQLIWYFGIQRREDRRDKIVEMLEAEVKNMRDEKLVVLDQRLTADHMAHGHLHDKINGHMTATREQFGNLHEKFVTFPALDSRLESVTRAEKQIERIWSRIEEVAKELTTASTIINMVANRMSITLPSGAQKGGRHEPG